MGIVGRGGIKVTAGSYEPDYKLLQQKAKGPSFTTVVAGQHSTGNPTKATAHHYRIVHANVVRYGLFSCF